MGVSCQCFLRWVTSGVCGVSLPPSPGSGPAAADCRATQSSDAFECGRCGLCPRGAPGLGRGGGTVPATRRPTGWISHRHQPAHAPTLQHGPRDRASKAVGAVPHTTEELRQRLVVFSAVSRRPHDDDGANLRKASVGHPAAPAHVAGKQNRRRPAVDCATSWRHMRNHVAIATKGSTS